MSANSTPVIYEVGDVASTMEIAREMMDNAKDVPYAVLAESQSKGRGTTGRTWVSPKGNMYFTLCVPERMISADLIPILPLINGLVCRAAITDLVKGANVHLKWPNDVIYKTKKVGGSLVENEKGYLILGLGMNVEIAPPVTDEGRESTTINQIATDLGEPTITPKQLAEKIWHHFFETLSDASLKRESVLQCFEAAMDKSLTLHRRTPTGRDPQPLRALRLNEWGHLIVTKPDGTEDTLMAEYLF